MLWNIAVKLYFYRGILPIGGVGFIFLSCRRGDPGDKNIQNWL
jgi:hypothetical protein